MRPYLSSALANVLGCLNEADSVTDYQGPSMREQFRRIRSWKQLTIECRAKRRYTLFLYLSTCVGKRGLMGFWLFVFNILGASPRFYNETLATHFYTI